VQDILQLVNVFGNYFYEHAVVTGSIIDPYDLRDLFKVFCHLIIEGTFFKVDPYKCGDVVAQHFEVNVQFSTFDNSQLL